MDSSHGKIVMPESTVVSEAEVATAKHHIKKTKISILGDSVDVHECAHAQFKNVAQKKEDEYLKGALHTGGIDRELQREIKNNHTGKKQNVPDNLQYDDPNNPQDDYEALPGAANSSSRPLYQQASFCPPGPNKQCKKPSTGSNPIRPRVHMYDSPNTTQQDLQGMRDQYGIQGGHQLSHHSSVSLHHQRSIPGPSPNYEGPLSLHQPQVRCIRSRYCKATRSVMRKLAKFVKSGLPRNLHEFSISCMTKNVNGTNLCNHVT